MSPREFMGYCFCDSRFKTIEDIILKGTLQQVLELQQVNEQVSRGHRYHQVVKLLEERLKND